MTLPAEYAAFERTVARALRAADPAAALRTASDDATLPDDLRAALRRAAPDGVRLAALLVARLRFERLMRGSDRAAARFERDPRGFADAFRRYHAEVAPTAFLPRDEAGLFEEWWSEAER